MANIFQLQRLAKRIPMRLRRIQNQLAKVNKEGGTEEGLGSRRQLLRVAAYNTQVAQLTLNTTLASRNVGGFSIRCSLPKKQQRRIGLLPALA